MKRRVSLSINELQSLYGDKNALLLAKDAVGVDAVDFCLAEYSCAKEDTIYAKGEAAVIEYFSELREYADSLGLSIVQTHGRNRGCCGDPLQDAVALTDGRLDCLATRLLGAGYTVMHGPKSTQMAGLPAQRARDIHFGMFAELLPYARENKVKIAWETGGLAGRDYTIFAVLRHADEFIRAYERITAVEEFKDWFCCCLDTGHSHLAAQVEGQPSVPDLTRRLGSAVEVLHIHDNDGRSDMHVTPWFGATPRMNSIQWWDFFGALDEIGYQGYYNLEIGLRHHGDRMAVDEAVFGIKTLKNLLRTYDGLPSEGVFDDKPYRG